NTESVFLAMDLVPSLIRLAGGKESDDDRFDGEDVLDTLLGKEQQSRSTPLFFSRPPDRKSFYGFENLPDLAVRDGRWKLLCDFDGSRGHLYDLSKDPGETKNLIEDHPEQSAKLTSAVTAWYAGVLDSNR
ncbi:MAG: N-acetylgalactosamine-6-sulfatase, partial [Haloferula sp.]